MNKTLISAFYEKTRELALLSGVRTSGTYGNFMKSVFGAFDESSSPGMQRLLLEIFVRPLARQDDSPGGVALPALSRCFFASCPPSFAKRLESYLEDESADSELVKIVEPQLAAYQAELLEEEKRQHEKGEADRLRREEQERTRRKEEEERRRARAEQEKERKKLEEEEERQRKAERDRQLAEQVAKARAANALQKASLWGAVVMAVLPVLVAGFSSAQLWWAQSNYAAIIFYVLFLAGGVKIFRHIVGLADYEWSLRDIWAAWLTAGVMVLVTYLSWSSVPNIIKAAFVVGTVALPFTPYARGAFGSAGAGIVAAIVFHFAARFCGFVAMAFLSWVLPAGSLPKVSDSDAFSGGAGSPVSTLTSFLPNTPASGMPVATYTARISPRDLRNSKGVYLPEVSGVKARDILLQERFNYHDGINRDYEDTSDSIHDPRQRTRLRKVFESRQVRVDGGGDAMALLESNPVLSVTVTDNEIVISPVR